MESFANGTFAVGTVKGMYLKHLLEPEPDKTDARRRPAWLNKKPVNPARVHLEVALTSDPARMKPEFLARVTSLRTEKPLSGYMQGELHKMTLKQLMSHDILWEVSRVWISC